VSQEELRTAIEGVVTQEADVTQDEAPQLDATEVEAYKEGWRPEAEFDGDKSKWIPADEFMRRKPLFSKIDELKSENYHTRKELQEVKTALRTFTEHHRKVEQTAYDRAIKELQAERRAAASEHDVDRMVELEEKLDQVKEDKAAFEQTIKEVAQPQVAPTPEYLEWVKGNAWYMTDSDMHDTADGIGYAYIRKNPNANPAQVYAHVTDKIQKAYPEKFSTLRKPSPVESGSSINRAPSKSWRKLTPEEDQIARTFERAGVMKRDEYIAELRKLEEK